MQIHPSTKKLIDRLYDMTLERKIEWKQGADGAVVYETERYRVTLAGSPTEVILSSDAGAELDKADHEELTNTLLDDGTTYAEYVGQLHKEAHRIARGAETAIDDVLKTLDEEANAPSAAPPMPSPIPTGTPTPDLEDSIGEPSYDEISSESVADAVASMAKDVNGAPVKTPEPVVAEPEPELTPEPELEEPEPEVIETPEPEEVEEPEPVIAAAPVAPSEPEPEPELEPETELETEPEVSAEPEPEPEPAPTPPSRPTSSMNPLLMGGALGMGGFGQGGFGGPASTPPAPAAPVEPEPEPEPEPVIEAAPTPVEPAPPQPTIATPPVPPLPEPIAAPEIKPAEEAPAPKTPPAPPARPSVYTPSSFGTMPMAPSVAPQPPQTPTPPLPEAAEPAPAPVPPMPVSEPAEAPLDMSPPSLPDMETGVEEQKIANLVGSITETVEDDAEPEEAPVTSQGGFGLGIPASVAGIAGQAKQAAVSAGETIKETATDDAESLKERSIGVIDEVGDVIRPDETAEAADTSEPESDPDPAPEDGPPKPPSKRFNPWR